MSDGSVRHARMTLRSAAEWLADCAAKLHAHAGPTARPTRARTILSMLVPPGAPIGSPQVMA